MVEESFLLPNLQRALDYLEESGALATILMCAGTFAQLSRTKPLFKPFDLGCSLLRAQGICAIGLITPVKEQEEPILQRWHSTGFTPTVWTADVNQIDEQFAHFLQIQINEHNLEVIVLDYVGHATHISERLQNITDLPVIDLGQLAIKILIDSL
jgi:hypothetical protein